MDTTQAATAGSGGQIRRVCSVARLIWAFALGYGLARAGSISGRDRQRQRRGRSSDAPEYTNPGEGLLQKHWSDPRNIQQYLRNTGWVQTVDDDGRPAKPDVWALPSKAGAYEVARRILQGRPP